MEASPIRVAFDHRIFSQQVYGGVSRYFADMVPHFENCAVDGRIFAPLHSNAYLGGLPAGLSVGRRMPQFRGGHRLQQAINGPLSRIAMLTFSPQIVHETYFGPKRQAPTGARLVLTVYDMIRELFPDPFDDAKARAVKAAAITRADLILCISENTRRDLIRFFPDVESRTRVTYLACGSDFESPIAPLRQARPYLLHVGQRGRYKNFLALLSAYAASSRLQADFDLICIGGGSFGETEKNLIDKYGLGEKVLLHFADDSQLRAWYAGAAVFVYPSLYEGFGIPPLEAMAANVPVVAVNTSSIPEVCGDGAELSANGSAEALRAAIESVAYDEARQQQLRRAGRARLELFSWAKTAHDTSACYRELV